jgi:hypothetical protein
VNIGVLRNSASEALDRLSPGAPVEGAIRKCPLLLLDRYSAFADVDLDVRGLLPLLVKLVAEDHGGDGEHPDDEVENIAIHALAAAESDVETKSGKQPKACVDLDQYGRCMPADY